MYRSASACFFACQPLTSERSTLARVTVYWRGEGSGEHASWNGKRLRESHCAVDPKKIPYGSKVVFPDATCVVVDRGPDVVKRKAASSIGFLIPKKGACLGKCASTFHDGANFNTRKQAGYQTRSHKKSGIIAEEYCQQR